MEIFGSTQPSLWDRRASLWKRVIKTPNGCWEWQGYCDGAGYGQIRIYGKAYKTHRLAYALVNGVFPEVVRHSCDNPKCCNPDHLLGGTHQDNVADRVARQRTRTGQTHGELNNFAKLTADKIRQIRALYDEGRTQTEIAKLFNIHQTQVSNIVRGKHWKQVTTYHKEIIRDNETRDYAMYLDGELVGFARNYHEADIMLDETVAELLRHSRD